MGILPLLTHRLHAGAVIHLQFTHTVRGSHADREGLHRTFAVCMQGSKRMKEAYWKVIDRLISAGNFGEAAQVTHHGHVVRALHHYQVSREDRTSSVDVPLDVSLQHCSSEKVVVILLAWAHTLSLVFSRGHKLREDTLFTITFGKASVVLGDEFCIKLHTKLQCLLSNCTGKLRI